MNGRAHHYGVTVSDMDAALEFYRDLLGFEEIARDRIGRGTEDGEALSRIVGVEDAAAELVFLDAGGCQIELLAYDPPGENANEGVSNDDPGAAHICVEVDDIDAAFEELRDEVEYISEPVTLSKGVRDAYVYDPDGNVVEISQRSGVEETVGGTS